MVGWNDDWCWRQDGSDWVPDTTLKLQEAQDVPQKVEQFFPGVQLFLNQKMVGLLS